MDRSTRILIPVDGPAGVRIAGSAARAGYEVWGVRGARWRLPVFDTLEVDPKDPVELVAAAADGGVDAVHPGDGTLARDPVLAREVVAAGLDWAGGRIGELEDAADRLLLRRIARDAGIEVTPADRLDDADAARAWLRRYGPPVLLRPRDKDGRSNPHAFDDAALAIAAIGVRMSGPWLIERAWPDARVVNVVLLGDGEGDALVVGDCEVVLDGLGRASLAVAPARLSDGERAALREAAVRFAERAWPMGVASVRFAVADDGRFVFQDALSGLPDGWSALGEAMGVDLVHFQLAVTEGEEIGWSDADIRAPRAAVEILLRATGRGEITTAGPGWLVPPGPIRVAEGDVVASGVYAAPTRAAAVVRAIAALHDLVTDGVSTNAAEVETALLDRLG